jgi:hypothetical protein
VDGGAVEVRAPTGEIPFFDEQSVPWNKSGTLDLVAIGEGGR